MAILPRRAGKDIVAFNLAVRQCLRKTCTVFYIFPTFSQGRRVLWDCIDNDGHRILDWYCPDEICDQKNSSYMTIRFKNGSILKVCGSDNYNALVGTNFQAVIFSEYALQDVNAYSFLRPICVANNAWMLFISTPRRNNHLYELYNIALNNPEWFVLKMNVEETGHIPISQIRKEQQEGIISEDLIQQEYYCSFDVGAAGEYYSDYINKMKLKGQINNNVMWESAFKVHTAWDLGVRDTTAIIFFQICNNVIRVIDAYESSDKGLEHYAKILNEKGYNYGRHLGPHDLKVREFCAGGITRLDKAAQLGIRFTICPNIPIIDGIENVRSSFSRMWINDEKCADLVKALENYRKDIRKNDTAKIVYADHPLHNWASNYSDAMRYLCVGLPKLKEGVSPEELENRYREAVLGVNARMPSVFRDDLPQY